MADHRKILVIGANHKTIADKYSDDKKGESRIKYKLTEAPKLHIRYIKTLETIISTIQNNPNIPNREKQLEYYRDIYDSYSNMDDFEFYNTVTEEYLHDDDGNTITDENPDAHYKYQHCYDDEVRKNPNNEAPFADPFILKDGTKAYSAKVGEIDWDIVHGGKSGIYEAVWELCVDGREPENDDEKTAKQVMGNKNQYFASFKNKSEYVKHNSDFWCYGVATEDEYIECTGRDIDWSNQFYERFIAPLSDDETVSIYEVQLI